VVRATKLREIADFDVERAACSTWLPIGSWTRRYRRVDTPASIRSITTPVSGSRSAKCAYVASGSS
jgi:hypothetical protein